VRNKALAILVTIALVGQLTGCASSPAQTGVQVRHVVTPPQKEKPAAPIAQEPKGFAENVALGDAAWHAQDLDRAIYYYVQALGESPHDAATLAKMGTIEDARGHVALAEAAFEMAHRADPKEPHIAERLARLYLQRGNVDGAAQIYMQVLVLDGRRTRALDGMGEVYLARLDCVQSIGYFDRALTAENPDKSAVLTHRSRAKLCLNDLTGAEADLRAALSVSPRGDSWRYLGDLQVLRGDTAAALDSLLNVVDAAHAFNEIGVIFMNHNNYSAAREYFGKAIKASAVWFDEAQKNLAEADEHLKKTTDRSSRQAREIAAPGSTTVISSGPLRRSN
jgi:tetratricopeptide (TPR) repeat protein